MSRPPSPGDDATPFLLRVFAKPAPFRPVSDFEPGVRPFNDEYKLYVWKTTTLREVAQMLCEANPHLSTPLALHGFRIIYYDNHYSCYTAKNVGSGITRVAVDSVQDLLQGLEEDSDPSSSSSSHPPLLTSMGLGKVNEDADEKAAKTTLAQLKIVDGDMLDCVVKPDPSLRSSNFGGAGRGSGQTQSAFGSRGPSRR